MTVITRKGRHRAESCAAGVSFDAAIALLESQALPLPSETVRLEKAGRRVLASPVTARVDAPRYDAAAMDGFAVADNRENYSLIGSVFPGEPWQGDVRPGEALRIMTGARAPSGAIRVIPLELVDAHGKHIWVFGDIPERDHIRKRGSDARAGDVVLRKGTILNPRGILVAAAADVATLEVHRAPVVHVVASGDELEQPGAAAERAGSIPDSLSEAVLLLVRQWGGRPGKAVLVPDSLEAIAAAADRAISECDILIFVGGASRGDRDFARAGLAPLGLELMFADVAMKPGKPVWYGRIGSTHVIGLPGNPTAAFTTARLFLVPLLCALSGRDLRAGLAWQSQAPDRPTGAGGARESFLCAISRPDGVEIVERQTASAQLMLAYADRLVRRAPSAPAASAGATVWTLAM